MTPLGNVANSNECDVKKQKDGLITGKIGSFTIGAPILPDVRNVYKCLDENSVKKYVIKVIEKCYDNSSTENEILVMTHLDHPNLLKLVNYYESEDYYFLVMEQAAGGDLYEIVKDQEGLDEKIAFRVFSQVVSALSWMHTHSVCHRDVKPENILLLKEDLSNPIVCLCDFGFATIFMPGQKLYGSYGTSYYMAPEIYNGQPRMYYFFF